MHQPNAQHAADSRAPYETPALTEFGSIDLAVAGYSRPVGIPEVDRVLMDFGRRGRMVG